MKRSNIYYLFSREKHAVVEFVIKDFMENDSNL